MMSRINRDQGRLFYSFRLGASNATFRIAAQKRQLMSASKLELSALDQAALSIIVAGIVEGSRTPAAEG